MAITRGMKAAQRRHCSPTLFDKLPAEMRDMIWHHVFSSLQGDVIFWQTRGIFYLTACDDSFSGYYPHPLLYAIKRFRSEIRQVLYQLVVVRLRPKTPFAWDDIPCELTQVIRRVKISASDFANSRCTFAHFSDNRGTKDLIWIGSFRRLAHVQIDWTHTMSSSQHSWDRRMAEGQQEMLVRFIKDRKDFDLTIHVAAREDHASPIALRGSIVDGTLKVRFKDSAHKDVSKWEEEIRQTLRLRGDERSA
ncbi:hypothetical protein PMZ80_010026 [Knufia obscura]|uniref:Uncharacterized protein n=1 Tax=Knufia obscura TaxID=1635080 RepID=A0ABR0RCE9_9EURO|nr:hypothetical protein PMZ80_010026 [Knufia obscura]